MPQVIQEMNGLEELKEMRTTGKKNDQLRPNNAPLESTLEAEVTDVTDVTDVTRRSSRSSRRGRACCSCTSRQAPKASPPVPAVSLPLTLFNLASPGPGAFLTQRDEFGGVPFRDIMTRTPIALHARGIYDQELAAPLYGGDEYQPVCLRTMLYNFLQGHLHTPRSSWRDILGPRVPGFARHSNLEVQLHEYSKEAIHIRRSTADGTGDVLEGHSLPLSRPFVPSTQLLTRSGRVRSASGV